MSKFKVGDKVKVLPGAMSVTDDKYPIYPEVAGDKTGTISRDLDGDGDYWVVDSDGDGWYIAPEYLEPLAVVEDGDTVRITDTYPRGRVVVTTTTVTTATPEGLYDAHGYFSTEASYANANRVIEVISRKPRIGDTLRHDVEYEIGVTAVLDTSPASVVTRQSGGWVGAFGEAVSTSDLAEYRWKIIWIPNE